MLRIVCLLATLLLAFPAVAQTPTPQDKETARSLMDVGDAKRDAGDLQAALDAYEAADQLVGVPTTGIEVGKTRIALGKLVEARDVLLRVSRHPVASDESPLFAKARSEALALADELSPRIPTLAITLVDPPPDVTVAIDGRVIEPAALKFPQRVNPGTREVTATAEGYFEAKQSVDLAEGAKDSLSLTLKKDPDYAPAAPDEATFPAQPAPPEEDGIHWLTWVGAAFAGAGLIAGSVAGGIALSSAGSLDDACADKTCSPRRQADIDALALESHLSTAGFVLAGAGGIALLFGILISVDVFESDDTTAIAVSVGPSALSLSGWF